MPDSAEEMPGEAENLRPVEAQVFPLPDRPPRLLEYPPVDKSFPARQRLVDSALGRIAYRHFPRNHCVDIIGLVAHIASDRTDHKGRIVVQIRFLQLQFVDGAESVEVEKLANHGGDVARLVQFSPDPIRRRVDKPRSRLGVASIDSGRDLHQHPGRRRAHQAAFPAQQVILEGTRPRPVAARGRRQAPSLARLRLSNSL